MKVFNKYVFRSIIFAVVLAATIFCPLFFLLPKMSSPLQKTLLAAIVCVAAAIEAAVHISVSYKLTVEPVKLINETADRKSVV